MCLPAHARSRHKNEVKSKEFKCLVNNANELFKVFNNTNNINEVDVNNAHVFNVDHVHDVKANNVHEIEVYNDSVVSDVCNYNPVGGFHKVPVQRTWWSVIQKNLIRT